MTEYRHYEAQYDTKNVKKLFSRSFKEMNNLYNDKNGNSAMGSFYFSKNDFIPIEYKTNSLAYRSEEFDNQEILTLGCSQTYGVGLPVELTWPHMLSQITNKKYINLALGGEGAQAQIAKAFQFCSEYYKPKYIIGLFPLSRLEVPQIKKRFYTSLEKMKKNEIENIDRSQNIVIKNVISQKSMAPFSKLPYSADEVLPQEFAIFYNMLFIKMFHEYCKSNNIKFLWTPYMDISYKPSFYTHIDMDSLFIEDSFYWNYSNLKDMPCHLDQSNHELFKQAADRLGPNGNFPHWGFHKHLHIAETLASML